MGAVFCTDKPDSLADKADSFARERGQENIVVVPNVALKMLKDHRVYQDQMKAKASDNWKALNLAFTNDFGDFISVDKLLRHFKVLLEKASLPHMRFHDLRHSAATILLSMGVHPKVVQELLGHNRIQETVDTYSQVLPTIHREAIKKLEDVLWNQ